MSQKIGIYITGYDKFSAVFKKAGASIKNLGSRMKKVSKPIRNASKALQNTSKSVKGLGSQMKKESETVNTFKRAMSTCAGMLMRDVVRSFSSAVSEAFKLGGQIRTLKAAFDKLSQAAGAMDLSLKGLRKATKGTVADVDLLTAANNALALGLPVDELDDLFAAAMDVGHAMGRTTLEAVQDLTTGIGRQSKLILDNLGILVDTNKAHEDYAEQLGKTTAELTDAEKKTAFMTAAISSLKEKSEILTGTTSEAQLAQEKWTASIKNSKTAVGDFLGPLKDLAPAFNALLPAIGSMTAVLLPAFIGKLAAAAAGTWGMTLATIALNAAIYANPYLWIIGAIVGVIAIFSQWKGAVDFVIDVLEKLWGVIKSIGEFFGKVFGAIGKFIRGLFGGGKKKLEVEMKTTTTTQPSAAEQFGAPTIPAQYGFEGIVRKPTWLLTGEKGPEYVSVTPRGKGPATGKVVNITINQDLRGMVTTRPIDPEELYRTVGDVTRKEMRRMGVKSQTI